MKKNPYVYIGVIGIWSSIISWTFIFYIINKSTLTDGLITLDFNHVGELLLEYSCILVIVCFSIFLFVFLLFEVLKHKKNTNIRGD